MANRTLRRPYKPANGSANGSDSDSGSVAIESGAVAHDDRKPDIDGEQSVERSDSVGNIGYVEVEPSKLGEFIAGGGTGNTNGDGNGTRKRRADAGIKRGKRARKEAPQNLEAVVTMIHTWASVLLKTPELMLTSDETKQLSDSYATFCEYHEVPILTPKRMSEINLIATLGMVYGTRIVAISKRRKEERKQKAQHGPQPIRQVQPIQPVM